MINFYDTCALLELQEKAFKQNEKFYISNITLVEIERIKTDKNKDEDVKEKARKLAYLLKDNPSQYNVILYHPNKYNELLKEVDLDSTPDNKIIITAYEKMLNREDILFLTGDLNCYNTAYTLGLDTFYTLDEEQDNYTGFKTIEVNDKELADFYQNDFPIGNNKYNLYINQYLLLKFENKITDMYKWTGEKYQSVPFNKFESKMFGKIMPKGNDNYQQIAMDSLATNQITMLRGRAGTGKSLLSFGYMFSLLDQGKIDKIIVFCNTVATKGSAKLGYYPGSRTEKLLDSQIGNFLISKLGDRVEVERLIEDGKLLLLPMSDIRGFDTSGMHAAVYITEAQNLDKELMKLALQRIGEDCICILDGDSEAQVDLSMYAGRNNGMKRVSKVYRGAPFYGEVTLQNIYRSKIATFAENL